MRTVIVGIGNDLRGDDGAGLAAARLLKHLRVSGLEVLEIGGDITDLLDTFSDCDVVVLIDAVVSQNPPGTIHRLDASLDPLPVHYDRRSTHGVGLSAIVELARSQGRLPRSVYVYGIEASSYEYGTDLSEPVLAAVKEVVVLVEEQVRALCATNVKSGD